MSNDFRLLLDTVAIERPARFDAVAVAAEGMPAQDQVHAALVLPDVDQFVDQEPLPTKRGGTEAAAISSACRVKMDRTLRSHRDVSRLEKGPLAVDDTNRVIVERIAEHATC